MFLQKEILKSVYNISIDYEDQVLDYEDQVLDYNNVIPLK